MATLARTQVAPSGRRRTHGAQGHRRPFLFWLGDHALAVGFALLFLLPFGFLFLTSMMTSQQALTGELWPRTWHPDNYAEVFRTAPLLRYLGNTVMYAVLSTLFMLLSSVPAAYALARIRFKGRTFAFLLVLTMMMLPPQVTQVPIYVMWSRLHLTGTLWPLILPNLLGDAFSIFLLRQFFLTIPQEYVDSAKVDGCGEWGTLLRIVVPMAKPGIMATSMFMFFYTWNDYYGPLLYTSENPDHWTISLGLATFRNLYQVQWNLTMAATLLVMLPVVVIFFLAQKAFVEGITLTGVKG